MLRKTASFIQAFIVARCTPLRLRSCLRPTIIVVQDGKEIGRVEGRPEKGTLEEALVKILQTQTGS